MKRALALALAASALSACDLLSGDFRLTGSVDLAPSLRARAPKQNAMLFVVAENAGGVPVAMERIVNPDFPAPFEMGPAELLVPAVSSRAPLTVRAMMNTRGDVGAPHPGDIVGAASGTFSPGAEGIPVTLDHVR